MKLKKKTSNIMQNKGIGQTPESNSCIIFQIKFLKEEALKVICQRTGDEHYNVNDIQWVLTVPAIWTPGAKQFMREAAYEVSLDKCSLFQALGSWGRPKTSKKKMRED